MTGQIRRGAAAGAVAAAAWAGGEPALRRLARTPYSDVRLLGRAVTRGRGWPVAGLALHLVNGALFGASFAALGLRGARAGVLAAEAENLVLWPGLLVVDRVHPDRREGNWPPLTGNPRVTAYAIAAHALFGFVLGRLTEPPEASPPTAPDRVFRRRVGVIIPLLERDELRSAAQTRHFGSPQLRSSDRI